VKGFILGILGFFAAMASAMVVGMIVQYHWLIIGRTNLLRLVPGKAAVIPQNEVLLPWGLIAALCLILAEVLWLLSRESIRKGETG